MAQDRLGEAVQEQEEGVVVVEAPVEWEGRGLAPGLVVNVSVHPAGQRLPTRWVCRATSSSVRIVAPPW